MTPPLAAAPTLAATTLTAQGTASTGETILFGVVALVTVCCALGVLTARRAVHAAINMIAIMISLAVLYIANEAPFLGVTQVVVYTGAIMTLVLFVIMLVGVGGEEPATGTRAARTPLVLLGAAGLAASLAAVVLSAALPAAKGLADSQDATPALLAGTVFSGHVVGMEVTGTLLVVAALGALTLTHRGRVRPRKTQRDLMEERMRDYAATGAHPGQKPISGVYARTNTAAAPALDASGKALPESVMRTLTARGQDLDLADVAPELAAEQRAGKGGATAQATVGRSGMAAMPGAAAPAVTQPLAPAALPAPQEEPSTQDGAPAGQDEATQTKEEDK